MEQEGQGLGPAYACADLEHGARVVCVGGRVPQVVSLHALVHQVPCLCQQAMPLHIHAMLLVPCRSRPASDCRGNIA